VDLSNANYPNDYNGNDILPMEGISLQPLFLRQAFPDDRMLFWEHKGNIAVRKGDMKLVKSHQGYVENKDEWQLYNLSKDRVEVNNIILQNEQTAKELQKAYFEWANRVGAIDWDQLQ
jgi:arylsulfatase